MTDLAWDDPTAAELLASEPPETWAEWEPELRRLLWKNRDDLKGAALVQALKAIDSLVASERANPDPEREADLRRPLLDRLDSLPAQTAKDLLTAETARIEQYLEDLRAARKSL